MSDEEVKVRIGTSLFSIPRKDIMEYPDATLARSLQDKGEEVEFKRSLICFEAIRDFYVCGKLHMPSSVCPIAFKEELHFWNIPDTKIELCCALKYQTYLDEMRDVEKFRLREAQLIDSKNNLHGRKNEIWKVLDNQSKSIFNTVYNIVSTALVLCSIVIMTVNMEHQMPGESESNTTQHQNVSMTPLQPESSDTQRDDTTIDILCVKDLSHEEEEQLFLMERICIKDCRRIEKPNFDTCSQQNKCSVDMWNSFKGHVFFNEICQECWPLFFPESTVDLEMKSTNDSEKEMNITMAKTEAVLQLKEKVINTESPPKSENSSETGMNISSKKEVIGDKVSIFIDKYVQKTTDSVQIKDLIDYENIFIVLFTTEFILRFITCPSKIKFIRSLSNVLDFIALASSWTKIGIILDQLDIDEKWVNVLMIGQMTRVFRLLRSIKHLKASKVLSYAFLQGCQDLLVIVLYVIVGIVIFGTLMFFVEPHDSFPDVGQTVWWSIITMTTVGYGDVYPTTTTGRIIACICALYGIVMLALTIPLFAQTFQTIYQYASLDDYEINNQKENPRKNNYAV